MNKELFIAVDFDGTCVTHEYPKIGKPIGAAPVLRELAKEYKLILYTMRDGKLLDEAVNWFKENDIPLYAVNENPSQKSWTSSPKIYANLYIDDAALSTLARPLEGYSDRPFINWFSAIGLLYSIGILPPEKLSGLAEEIKKDFKIEI